MDVYLMNSDGSGVLRLTSDANDDSMATWSPDGSKIVFQSMRNGLNYQVYSMNADGSNQVNLSNNSSSDGEPSWSPDGTKIAFATDRDHAGYGSIYVMNSDGSNQHALTFASGEIQDTQPVWSPDGSKIAFVSTRDSTTETWQETDDDGNVITRSALHVNKEVYVMNADGSAQTRLTTDPANDESPSWSPLGLTILFRSDRERECCDPTAQLWSMNADGTNQINLSNDGNSNDYNPAATIDIANTGGQLASNYSGGNQRPVANAGGSYTSQAGQSVQLNGSASFDPDGTIVNYAWNFGDGTSGTGAVANHQYGASGVYPVSLTVSDNSGNTSSAQGFVTVDSVALPVKITFDDIPHQAPNGTIVADQYLKDYGVRFSSANFFFPVHTKQDCGPFCGPTSFPNFISTKPDDAGQLVVTFQQSVSNLVFFAVGVDTLFGTFAFVDLYRNGSVTPTNTFAMNGNFSPTVGFSSGTLNNIDKLVVRGITDAAGIGFDDFSFTVPAEVRLTSSRVTGNLNSTTQNALVGAGIGLNASTQPGAFAGGTFSWSCNSASSPNQCSIVAGQNTSSVTLRTLGPSTRVGDYNVTVTYSKNGVTASSSLTIKSIMPTLTQFSAQLPLQELNRDRHCADKDGVTHSVGCFLGFNVEETDESGIRWHTTATIPNETYLSNPAESGIKFVQAVATFIRVLDRGNRTCLGFGQWQLDTRPTYNTSRHPVQYFSSGNTLNMSEVDEPVVVLQDPPEVDSDAYEVDNSYETYVYYFVTNPASPNPNTPFYQTPMGFANQNLQHPYAALKWSFEGSTKFTFFSDPSSLLYGLTSFSNPSGFIPAEAVDATKPMDTNFTSLRERPCGDSAQTTNPIDGSKFYVDQLYLDFLGRNTPDAPGENFWRTNITDCEFDSACIDRKRIDVARAFFYCDDFINQHPELTGTTRGTHEYNAAFVNWCYEAFLRRDPCDEPDGCAGFNFWVGKLDSSNPDDRSWKYNDMLNAFIRSTEYRSRFGSI